VTTAADFPTTDKYRLGVDIDLKAVALRHHFTAAIGGVRMQELTRDMLRQMTRQPNLGVLLEEDRPARQNSYAPSEDTITINDNESKLHRSLGVSRNNMPPIIPKEFTPELDRHLGALHEAEHRTQHVIIKDKETGEVDFLNSRFRILLSGHRSYNPLGIAAEVMVHEADGDLPVLQHLDEMGLPHVAQFYMDVRAFKATMSHLPTLTDDKYREHDVSAVVEHFRANGKVLDPVFVLIEKELLLNQVRAELRGQPYDWKNADAIKDDLDVVLRKYGLNRREMFHGDKKLSEDTLEDIFLPRPQIVMAAMQRVLERGYLSEFQKQEAERFMDATLRLGYTPENRTYLDQVRDVLENHLGLKPVAPAPEILAPPLGQGPQIYVPIVVKP
jgi:hypothetical protein